MYRAENEWQLDSFELEGITNGRPLSCLAFHLFMKTGLVSHFSLNETKLARQVQLCLLRAGKGGRGDVSATVLCACRLGRGAGVMAVLVCCVPAGWEGGQG